MVILINDNYFVLLRFLISMRQTCNTTETLVIFFIILQENPQKKNVFWKYFFTIRETRLLLIYYGTIKLYRNDKGLFAFK